MSKDLFEEIARFAAEAAGTEFDLDPMLEQAAQESMWFAADHAGGDHHEAGIQGG